METDIFLKLGLALALGFLVGLQRERAASAIAGIRTFPLISLFGALCGFLALDFGGWIIAAGLIALAALIVVGNILKLKAGDTDPGLTTEVAALLLYGVGVYLVVGNIAAAVVVGGMIALLLYWKKPLHTFAATIGEADFKAIMQFVFISLVILPILPNQNYGPYDVLNPFEIWLMVVFIVGINIVGYVAYKFFGTRAGAFLSGVLGGLISSTATTVSCSRQTRSAPHTSALASLVIIIASTVVFGRVLIEIAVVAPGQFGQIAPPLIVMTAAMVTLSLIAFLLNRREHFKISASSNPAQLRTALVFGALYAVVKLAVASAKDHFGSGGLYLVAFLSGLTDMDAITLSTAQLVESSQLNATQGWQAILIAALSNFLFKASIIATLGHRSLLSRIAILFGIGGIAGFAILWLWPR